MKKQPLYFLVFCLSLLATSPIIGQSFSLLEAQDYAIKNSYTLRESGAELEKAQARVNEVIASGLPQITGGVNYQNFLKQPVSVIPAEFLEGSQVLFRP